MADRDEFAFLKVIQKLDLFRSLNPDEARKVLAMCEQRNFRGMEVVWEPKSESTDCLILITGRLVVTDEEGTHLADVNPGASFGEMGCLTGHPRFVGITAHRPSVALAIHRRDLLRLKAKDPALYIKILENAIDLLAHRLTGTEHPSHDLHPVEKRKVKRW